MAIAAHPEPELRRPMLAFVGYYGLTVLPLAISGGLLAGIERAARVDLPILTIVIAMLALRQVNGFIMSALYHRGMSHGSVQFTPWLERLMRLWGWYFMGAGVRTWAAVHRWHHAAADTADDPHSPTKPGASFSRIMHDSLRTFRRVIRDPHELEPWVKGLPNDRLERFIQAEERRFFGAYGVRVPSLIAVLTICFMATLPWPWALAAAVACLPGITGAVLTVTIWIVNGLGHTVGYRNFDTRDTSTNIIKKDVFSLGESLHNNHHARPGAADLAARPGEWDSGYAVLRGLKRLGVVTYLRGREVAQEKLGREEHS